MIFEERSGTITSKGRLDEIANAKISDKTDKQIQQTTDARVEIKKTWNFIDWHASIWNPRILKSVNVNEEI